MNGSQYTIDIIHLPTRKRFCQSVEAMSHEDARRYAGYVVEEIRHANCLWYGKMKISVKKSPFNHHEMVQLYLTGSIL